jgi:hypothetical protein
MPPGRIGQERAVNKEAKHVRALKKGCSLARVRRVPERLKKFA